MTEDTLEEQSEVLAKLGTSAEGSQLRARMQSASLLSDMESFKVTLSLCGPSHGARPSGVCGDSSRPWRPQAANPGCVLEDFVRWYSPRDYVEEEEQNDQGQLVVKGTLSARMKIPGNMWVEAWETARVTPARRQKRLFDDTKEAEKVTKASPEGCDCGQHGSRLFRGESINLWLLLVITVLLHINNVT